MIENIGSFVAIITARGGSKGLPRKNILPLRGKPLVAYSIDDGLSCPYISKVVVTTDDDEIEQVAKSYGAEVIRRPPSLATDTASSYDTVKHALLNLQGRGISFDSFVLLQPTSPLRRAMHVTEAIEGFVNSGAKSSISLCEVEHHPYKCFIETSEGIRPVSDNKYIDMPRQKLQKAYRQNGAVYIMGCDDFINKADSFLLSPMEPYFMSRDSSIDIDSAHDLIEAEALLP
jgi:CMP-N,N'-diacetyllegionaminic acid synthase